MKRWKKALIWTGSICGGLLLLVLILVPLIAPGIIQKQIIARVPEHLNATAEIGSTSFSWPGTVTIKDLVIKDPSGKTVVSVGTTQVRVGLISAIFGSYSADVLVENPEVNIWKDGDLLNFEKLMKQPPVAVAAAPTPSETPKPVHQRPKEYTTPKGVPPVSAKIRVVGGKINIADTKLTDLTLSADVESLNAPVVFSASANKNITIAGSVTIAKDGFYYANDLKGSLNITVEGLDFGAYSSAAALLSPLRQIGGRLDASMKYTLEPGMKISGGGRFTLADFLAAGDIIGPEPVKLPSVKSTHDITIEANGNGMQNLTLDAGDFLHFEIVGASKPDAFDGRVTGSTNLRGLSESLASLLNLKAGYRLDGSASIDGRISAAPKTRQAMLDLTAKIVDLAPVDAAGKAIPLGTDKDVTLEMKAAYDGQKDLVTLSTCRLQSGSVQVRAEGGYEKGVILKSVFSANADLDSLAAKLASFMDLPFSFGGKVAMEGGANGITVSSKIDVTAFLLKWDGKTLGPIDIKLEQSGRVDLQRGGRCALDSFSLTSSVMAVYAQGEVTNAMDKAEMSGRVGFTVKVFPAELSAKLAPLLEGYSLRGSPIEMTGDVTFHGPTAKIIGRVTAPVLGAAGPALINCDFVGAIFGFDVGAHTGTMAVDINYVTLHCGKVSATLAAGAFEVAGAVAKVSGFKKGAVVDLKGDVMVDSVKALDKVTAKKLDLRFATWIDSESFDANADSISFSCDKVDLTGPGGASAITGISLKFSGGKVKDDADLRNLEFTSSLCKGSGQGSVKNLMKDGMTASGNISFQGDVAPAVEVAKAFMADLKGATATGKWDCTVAAKSIGKEIEIKPKFEVKQMDLKGVKDMTVEKADLTFDSMYIVGTTQPGTVEIKYCTLTAPGLTARVFGNMGGFLATPIAPTATLQIDAKLMPKEINDRLPAFLMGNKLEGEPATARMEVTVAGDRYGAKGSAIANSVTVTMPTMAVTQKNMTLDFDMAMDLTFIDISDFRFKSDTASATAKGRITGLDTKMVADMVVTCDASIEKVMKDFGLEQPDMTVKGKATAKFTLKYEGEDVVADGTASITDFEQAAAGITIQDPKIGLDAKAYFDPVKYDVVLKRCDLTSLIANGGVRGSIQNLKVAPVFDNLKGEFTYVPSKVGALLKSKLPGELRGDNQEKVEFTLNGKCSEFDPWAILRATKTTAQIGMGQFVMNGLSASGVLDLTITAGQLHTDNTFKVNEGGIVMRGDADMRKPKPGMIPNTGGDLTFQRVRLNPQMSPLLQMVHPMFAKTAETAGEIDGWVDSAFKLRINTFIGPDVVAGGWEKFPKNTINGSGNVSFSELQIKNSRLLAEMLDAFGGGDQKDIRLKPLVFTITAGRLAYAQPWQWTVAGSETTFSGDIGIFEPESTKALNLKWNIPVTEKMVEKVPQLKYFKGTKIEIPITGSLMAPRFGWKELLGQLIKEAIKKEAEEAARDALTDLFGDKKAKKLLEEADALYAAGKKAEAAPKYKKIKDDYDKSRTYKDNKDRIKQRMNEK